MAMLEDILKVKIKTQGPISFEEFMREALYHPEHGYYMSEVERIGPTGDYYTSPHLHPLFGYMIGIQIIELLHNIAKKDLKIVEIGAGRGYMAEGILQCLYDHKVAEKVTYIIVERNPHQQKRQMELLNNYPQIQWVRELSDIRTFSGVVVSNELLDAFPVHLIQFHKGEFYEVFVDLSDEGKFIEVLKPLSDELKEYIERYKIPKIEGYRTEINLQIRYFLSEVSKYLQNGFLLTIDYGYPYWAYYAEERTKGTLLCYYRHRSNDNPYINIGQQDITAHVNFTYMDDTGRRYGFKTIGFTPQGTFLTSLGIDKVMSEFLQKDPGFMNEIHKIKGLLWGMGETHQVMLQYKGPLKELPIPEGFKLRNRMYNLHKTNEDQ